MGVGWHRTAGATAQGLSGGWSGLDTHVMGVLLNRDTKVTPEMGVERVLQLPGVSCFSG